jgi:glycosyltransferase involved in cell wall biosynthesis
VARADERARRRPGRGLRSDPFSHRAFPFPAAPAPRRGARHDAARPARPARARAAVRGVLGNARDLYLRRATPAAADGQLVATIHHGLPDNLFDFRAESDGYLAFLGRISLEKRVDRAIAIATALNWPLKIAAKVDPADVGYFERDVRPLLDNPLVEFIGEIDETQKNEFLGRARALLFPIDWPEPFGLVMIESLACGTPVVAFRAGSVEEVIEHGRTGFIVDTEAEAIEATRRIGTIDRRACRRSFEQRFTSRRMVERHLSVYRQIINARATTIEVAI